MSLDDVIPQLLVLIRRLRHLLLNQKFLLCPKFLKVGGGLKPNTNVPNVDVPKWLWRGGVRPNWDNVLKSVLFYFEGIP